jgi:hypothetical protein
MRYIGYDKKGIIRVIRDAEPAHVAHAQCLQAARDYVKRRPDTGPVCDWIIERPDNAWLIEELANRREFWRHFHLRISRACDND